MTVKLLVNHTVIDVILMLFYFLYCFFLGGGGCKQQRVRALPDLIKNVQT